VTATQQTASPTIGCGRSLGYALGAMPWPDGVASRIVLNALIPHRYRPSLTTKRSNAVKRWLRRAQALDRVGTARTS
jgi:hypothetical protein